MLVDCKENRASRNAVVGGPPVEGHDGIGGVHVDGGAERTGKRINARSGLEGKLVRLSCSVDLVGVFTG